ncbi:hypothetical protein HAX54_047624 [Datura stramonium]|uniref:Uncharacterized protein n=1 Tax=Datura stramonium TaxID=4076 RepID=A0ABS8STE2_DATST|nr:hypothetical protein [Datura stramonium]
MYGVEIWATVSSCVTECCYGNAGYMPFVFTFGQNAATRGGLCARVDMLEEEIGFYEEEMDRQKKMNLPMDIDLNILVVGCDSPVADERSSDDLCVGYSPSKDLVAGEVQDCKPPTR